MRSAILAGVAAVGLMSIRGYTQNPTSSVGYSRGGYVDPAVCAKCHGDIAAKKTITQDEPFTMGRCLACHAERGATRDCLGCHK